MGRFYETSTPQFIDNKMYELPYEMMYKAIQTKDKAVDDTISTAVSLFDNLKANVYTTDADRANQIIMEKQQKIDEIVSNIKKSPGDYNKFSGDIRTLGRDIAHTFTQPTGEITLMEKNNKDIVSQIASIKEKHKNDPAYAEAEINALKQSYAQGLQYDPTARRGKSNPNIVQTYDLSHTVDDFLKTKLEGDEWEKEKDTRSGTGYIYRDKKSREELTPEKIAQAYQQYFNSHQDIQGAVGRRKELGVTGFTDADLANSVNFNEKGQIAGIGSDWYGRNIGAAIANMKYVKTKDSNTIHDDAQFARTQARGWALADKEKETPEHIGWTYGGAYQVDANSAGTFQNALTNANTGLFETYNQVLSASGVQPNSELGKMVLSGNSHAIKAALAKAEPATAQKITNTYEAYRTQKNFLNAQAEGFKDYAAKKGIKIDTSKGSWLNAKTQTMYNEYLQSSGTALGEKNISNNLITLDKTGISKETNTELRKTLKQNFDDLVFNVDQTVKGSYLTFEKADGNKVIYVPQGDKQAGKIVTITPKEGNKSIKKHTVEYRTAPGGMLSVQSLIKDGLVMAQKGKDDEFVYTTRENGKNVGIVPDEETFGLDNSLDNAGRSNYGMTMQVGNYRLPVLIPTDAIKIPSVDRYVQENYDDMQFNQFMKKTNLNTLGKATAPGPNGSTLMTEKGRAYYITSKGEKQEITAPEQKREIYKIIFAEN